MERTPLTREGYETLRNELNRLRTIDRPQNIKDIETARAHGDLSENAEFEAAKERQSFIEGRINELNYKINNADIIDTSRISKDRVVFGSTVLLENDETGDDIGYQLVGPDESDISKGKISITSPLGQALLGKEPGAEIVIQAPGGKRVYDLVDII